MYLQQGGKSGLLDFLDFLVLLRTSRYFRTSEVQKSAFSLLIFSLFGVEEVVFAIGFFVMDSPLTGCANEFCWYRLVVDGDLMLGVFATCRRYISRGRKHFRHIHLFSFDSRFRSSLSQVSSMRRTGWMILLLVVQMFFVELFINVWLFFANLIFPFLLVIGDFHCLFLSSGRNRLFGYVRIGRQSVNGSMSFNGIYMETFSQEVLRIRIQIAIPIFVGLVSCFLGFSGMEEYVELRATAAIELVSSSCCRYYLVRMWIHWKDRKVHQEWSRRQKHFLVYFFTFLCSKRSLWFEFLRGGERIHRFCHLEGR